MTPGPSYEPRREEDFERELRERARVWLPEWQVRDAQGDLAGALFKITARLASEVAQRLDRIPEKNFRGLLHWLGVRGEGGHAARVPVVFQMAEGSEPVRAAQAVQIQAQGAGEPVIFETLEPLELTSAPLVAVVATDPAKDAYFTPPPGLFSLAAPESVPTEWTVVSEAPLRATSLQLDPQVGPEPGTVLQSVESPPRQYTVVEVKDGLCIIDPPVGAWPAVDGSTEFVGAGIGQNTQIKAVSRFNPFDSATRDAQEHTVYIGSKNAFDIESSAEIELRGWEGIDSGFEWAYWGKSATSDQAAWVPLGWKQLSDRRVLDKGSGSIDERDIQNRTSRWLRATRKSLRDRSAPPALDPLRIRINCGDSDSSVTIEGITNSTPLDLNAPPLYPLGREPRLFDSFYLGSKEAFSKPHAEVKVRLEIGDEWSSAPTVITYALNNHVLFAVGTDNALRVIAVTESAGDVNVVFHLSSQPPDGSGHFVKLSLGARPGAALLGANKGYVSASHEREIWLWSAELALVPSGAWESLGEPAGHEPPPDAPSPSRIETLLTRNSANSALFVYALVDGALYRRQVPGTSAWTKQAVVVAGVDIPLDKIVAVQDPAGNSGAARDQDGLLGVGLDGRLYLRDSGSTWQDVTPSSVSIDTDRYPALARVGGAQRCYVALKAPTSGDPAPIFAFDPADSNNAATRFQSEPVDLIGHAIDVVDRAGNAVAVFAIREQGATRVAQWDAFAGTDEPILSVDIPFGSGALSQAPARVGSWLAAPAEHGTLRLLKLDAALHFVDANADVTTAAVVNAGVPIVAGKSYRVDLTPDIATKQVVPVKQASTLGDGRLALVLEKAVPTLPDGAAFTLYQDEQLALFAGTNDSGKLVLDATDTLTAFGDKVYLRWMSGGIERVRIRVVDQVDTTVTPNVATLDSPLPSGAVNIDYVPMDGGLTLEGTFRPVVELPDNVAKEGITIAFPGLAPRKQRVISFAPASASQQWALLAEPWTTAPAANPVLLIADASFSAFREAAPVRGRNPELSWEYWDGRGWWKIAGAVDGTDNLVTTGDVTFCVPENIAATEVAGHENFWVRARLIGGDYGQEKLVITTSGAPPTQTQTITRDTSGIRAPYVVRAAVKYSMCCPVAPDYLLTRDSGNTVDQSAANRDLNSKIESFTPLSESIDGAGRALYLGFGAALRGRSASLLFLLDEAAHSDAFPLRVDVRKADGFAAFQCDDETRGLSESGFVKLSFDASPVQAALFGQSLFWLRLRPREGFEDSEWQPAIRAVYVNAAWTEARETQRNEILGSSDGRPELRVVLARTPVIERSLRLRVRERLSREERDKLNEERSDAVRPDIDGLPGPWVLWREVNDLLSAASTDRVYQFDDETGIITFGDGQHGMIPPIGRDSILAEQYLRGGGAAANNVRRFDAANLVTPLQGVESAVFAADSAGGSDPEDAQRTLRFAPVILSQRESVVTLADLEFAALRFSSDIVQAVAHRAAGRVDLYIMMRGSEPRPSAAVMRELTTRLRQLVSPHLAIDGALVVRKPDILLARAKLSLRITSLDYVSDIAAQCGERIRNLLNPETGGFDGAGWPLGASPSTADLAACLDEIEHLEEILAARLVSAAGELDTALRPKYSELVQLADDGVSIEVRTLSAGEAA